MAIKLGGVMQSPVTPLKDDFSPDLAAFERLLDFHVRTSGTAIPARAGSQGPGEMTMAAGASPTASSTVTSSLRRTRGSVPSPPRYCTRFQVKLS